MRQRLRDVDEARGMIREVGEKSTNVKVWELSVELATNVQLWVCVAGLMKTLERNNKYISEYEATFGFW